MRKLIYLLVITVFLCTVQSVSAQTNYINHTLQQGETLSALASQYNTNVGDIMRINNMHADSKLVYGSVIKIPSNKKVSPRIETVKPVAQQIDKPAANAITHTVAKGETLFSISKRYNISIEQIKAWNNLTDNSAKLGSVLIVGRNNDVGASDKSSTEIKKQRVETTVAQPSVQPAFQTEQNTEIKNNIIADTTSNNILQNNISNNNTAFKTKDETANIITDKPSSLTNITKNSEGYFADVFKQTRKQQHASGISKTFKTASGLSDGKYYILADDINPGTIVKLTADNGSSVYAKVLWNMGSLRENGGINFRVSNATAAALNENTDSFNLNVVY